MSRSLRSLKVGECLPGRGHCSTGDPIAGLLSRGRERDLPGSQAIHPVPLPRSTTPAEPTIPRLLTVSSMLPPLFPRRRLQRLMNFGALLRGFSTCCLRFKSDVATTHAKLASGRLARLYREGVEPFGSLQKVSDHISRPPFLDLSWRKESFMTLPPLLPSFVVLIAAVVFDCSAPPSWRTHPRLPVPMAPQRNCIARRAKRVAGIPAFSKPSKNRLTSSQAIGIQYAGKGRSLQVDVH